PSTTVGPPLGPSGPPRGWTPSLVTGKNPAGDSSETTVIDATPSLSSVVAATFSNSSSPVTMTVGLPDPAAKCSLITSWPSRAPDSPSTNSLSATPLAFNPSRPKHPIARTIVAPTHVDRKSGV